MRTIAHISDIHFGRTDEVVVDRLVEKICGIGPDLVVVSGDLTQRARTEQFVAAREFLKRLPGPQIVVPGNHDVPLYNVYNRFARPLEKYKKYITSDLMPLFCDEEIAVLGVNTARSMTIKGGWISREQVAEIRERFEKFGDQKLRMIVTHHPFDLPEGVDDQYILRRAEEAMREIAGFGADVFLAGHLHVSHVSNSARRYTLEGGRSALIVQAGTAASTRERGEPNSFNVLEIDHPSLAVKRYEYRPADAGFIECDLQRFTQTGKGWRRE